MTTGTETVEFSAHLDQVRVRVTDGEGRQLASILCDIPDACDWHAQLYRVLSSLPQRPPRPPGPGGVTTEEIPLGICQCGCGKPTSLPPQTITRLGWVRGKPRAFFGHHARRRRVRYVVEDRGYRTPCWVWQMSTSRLGYAQEMADGRVQPGHVRMWEQEHGPVPDGLELDHLCRVRACVNPAHLEPVTHAENMRRAAGTKLTADNVREIRNSAERSGVLAERFGVTAAHIRSVRRRRTWADLP